MNIVMFTNTYIPHVGGVARSVQGVTSELRRLGHRTLVIAPVFDGMDKDEVDVVRMPALQRFNGSDFSLPVPVPGKIARVIEEFSPHIIHSHHPFLLGDAALRAAAVHNVPAVFTHHTQYEQYTHYMPGDSSAMKRFVIELVTGYCNLCTAVIAPSRTIADILHERGVRTLIEVIPTGVDPVYFSTEGKDSFRRKTSIPEGSFVVGHVGRLALEKNLDFLCRAVSKFMKKNQQAHFLLIGEGSRRQEVENFFAQQGQKDRLHLQGVLQRRDLADAYRYMNVFVFASNTETQGIVLAEAMASGTPVVAVDAPGVREIVHDGENGRLLQGEDASLFAAAVQWIAEMSIAQRNYLEKEARSTAREYSLEKCAYRMLDLYTMLRGTLPALGSIGESRWERARNKITKQLDIMRIYGQAAEDAVFWTPQQKDDKIV